MTLFSKKPRPQLDFNLSLFLTPPTFLRALVLLTPVPF